MSNQYAVIPAIRESELKLEYSIANPSTWRFQRLEVGGTIQEYVGVEEHEFSAPQMEELRSIEGVVFFPPVDVDDLDWQAWLNQYGDIGIVYPEGIQA
jgi:hypothetical protein